MAYYAKFTPQKQGRFLAELRKHGNATRAAQTIGVTRVALYNHRRADKAFDAEWVSAREEYAEQVLEVEADRRAVEGVLQKTYYDADGNVVGEERRYSDTLLIFRLKALKPQDYKERYEVGGDPANPMVITTPEERQRRIEELEAKRARRVMPLALVDPE